MLRQTWPSLFCRANLLVPSLPHADPHPQRPCDSDQGAPCSGLQFPKDSPLQPQIPSQVSPKDLLHSSSPTYFPSPRESGGRWHAHIDTEECSHAVQVVGVPRHGQDLGDYSSMGPLLPELLHQLLQVAGGRLADGVDCGRRREGGRLRR